MIRYADLVPPEARSNARRLRAQAYFEEHPEDARFRLLFFDGDPDAYPTQADPEALPEDGPGFQSVGVAEDVEPTRNRDYEWYAATVRTEVPENTDFIVVQAMGRSAIDYVLVTLDTGNTRLFANDDFYTTGVNTPVEVQVLNNDYDVDSRIDPSTLTVVSPPSSGQTEVHLGALTSIGYTPNPDFVGFDTFRYIVADDEGLFSGEATVTVEVRPSGTGPLPATLFEDGFDTNPAERWRTIVTGSGFGFLEDRHLEVWRSEGGNPGGFRWMKHTTQGQGEIRVHHVYRPHYYLPRVQGPLDSLTYFEDRRSFNKYVGANIVIVQGAGVYTASLPPVNPDSSPPWTTEARRLKAMNFLPTSPCEPVGPIPCRPDFSANGDTLWFGYGRLNSNTNPDALQETEHGIDNWKVILHTQQPG